MTHHTDAARRGQEAVTGRADAFREAYSHHAKACERCENGGAVHLCPEGEVLHRHWRESISAAAPEERDDA